MATRRVPKTVAIRNAFSTSIPTENTSGIPGTTFGSVTPLMAARARPVPLSDTPGILNGGFEYLRYRTIVFGICNITNPTITYELSLVDANGVGLAVSGPLTKTVVDGRITGSWEHGVAERNDVFCWFYCTSDANYDVEWSIAMINSTAETPGV